MNRYLLLILLSSWSLLVTNSLQCETGVAYPGHILSVQRSLMANADVAFLTAYESQSVEACMQDCCSGKYGACTVASFRKDAKKDNCLLFNCRPLNKCKFLSSNSTDSFSFSSSPVTQHSVPSRNTSTESSNLTTTTPGPLHKELSYNLSEEHGVTKEEIATFSHEQFDLKNDNTTIKPRKGVNELFPDDLLNASRSGIKPRKGVSMEDVPHSQYLTNNITKSKVKPRKGVGPYISELSTDENSSQITSSPEYNNNPTTNKVPVSTTRIPVSNRTVDSSSLDFISALEKVFEDDPMVQSSQFLVSATSTYSVPFAATSTVSVFSYPTTARNAYVTSSVSTTLDLKPSLSQTTHSYNGFSSTPTLESSSTHVVKTAAFVAMPSSISVLPVQSTPLSQASQVVKLPRLSDTLKKTLPTDAAKKGVLKTSDSLRSEEDKESENERRYKSSMHLVLSLIFGLLVLFAVLGVVAKRVYDSWMRRHYRRMDFLIDGMYNGYG